MRKTITAGRLVTPHGTVEAPRIAVDNDGMIVSVAEGDVDGDETTLTASFFDVHIHGAVNHDVMQASPSGFAAIEEFLASRGVGHYLPTTVTATVDETLRALERLAGAIERSAGNRNQGRATPVGIHLEGPFISHIKRGVHPPEAIQLPEIGLFNRFQEAARGHVRLMTVAPETPGALDLIEHATRQGVRVSLGHTNALAAEAHAAIANGASSATHTFNAMRAMDHREPGVVGVVLAERNVYAELICDGIHVAPEMVEVFLRSKGLERAILVTDGMSAMGMGDGSYKLGNFDVEVRDGRAMARGVLAGSVLTMDKAVENFARFTGTPFLEATRCASDNPARMLGLKERFTIAPGRAANLIRFDADGRLVEILLGGISVAARA